MWSLTWLKSRFSSRVRRMRSSRRYADLPDSCSVRSTTLTVIPERRCTSQPCLAVILRIIYGLLLPNFFARDGLPFEVLRPLLEETLRKAFVNSPAASQTGPAARGDRRVIDGHLSLLDGREKEIYSLLSDCIMSRRSNK